jgi:TfoX/Sxy family transcriptional regulator of competence genes
LVRVGPADVALDVELQARVQTLLAEREDVEEKRMVGGMSFVVGGHLCVGVSGDALLLRVGPAGYEAALDEPGVRPLRLGRKHPVGYVLVDHAATRSDGDLEAWVRRGLSFVESQPPPRARSAN